MRAYAMTSVVMGDEIEVTWNRTPLPRLGPDFFVSTEAVRKHRSRRSTTAVAQAA